MIINVMKCVAIGLVIALVASGCMPAKQSPNYDDPWTKHGLDTATKVVMIEGHKYILYDGYYSGGIIHAESCRCRK